MKTSAWHENTSRLWINPSPSRDDIPGTTLSHIELTTSLYYYVGIHEFGIMVWISLVPLILLIGSIVLTFLASAEALGKGRSMAVLLQQVPMRWWYNCTSLVTRKRTSIENCTIPRHIAVIMDGNRRYGKQKYGISTQGHSDGSQTLVHFIEWCMKFGVQILTVYAFSTENWNRDPMEVQVLMGIFEKFMKKISPEAVKKNVQVRILRSDSSKLPRHIVDAVETIERETVHCTGFVLNVCVSYGSRNEVANACKSIAADVQKGLLSPSDVTEDLISSRLLTGDVPDPDILLRTSGELRISNFLLYQIAYSELIFLEKYWPEIQEEDVRRIIQIYNHRKRRYGK